MKSIPEHLADELSVRVPQVKAAVRTGEADA
jgi:hypothetical protein